MSLSLCTSPTAGLFAIRGQDAHATPPESSPDCPCDRPYWEDTVCDGYDPLGQFGGEGAFGCGYHRTEQGCRSFNRETQQCEDDPHAGYNCVRRVEGLSYFACTPDQCNAGWDANHGGLFKKNRLDHEWCHDGNCGGLFFKATGNEFSGNCLGDMIGCGTLYPLGEDDGLWFHEVTGIYWRGLVPSWYSGCDGMPGCSSDCSFGDTLALPPQIPGYGYHGANGERRVVLPVRETGKDLGYTARAIDANERKRWLSQPVEGGHKTVIYEPDAVLAGGDTLFIVEGPFDALMITAAMQPGNDSVATALFGSLPTAEQLAYIMAAIPLFRMVYVMLDANVCGRCRRLAQQFALAAGALNVGSINIGIENRDPGATRFEELAALVEFASASWQTEIRWMWERRLVFTGAGGGKE